MTTTTAAHQPTFDLRTQPWLLARTLDGAVEQVSLVEVLARAHELGGLVGDVPTQTFALHRLLLALLHRSVPWDHEDPDDHWAAAWRGEVDLAAAVAAHLDRHADRFDLLHPTTPFYQVAGLRTAKDGASSLTALVADVPNNAQYFTTRGGAALQRIGLAEAARWVVHAHAFDVSGIKSGAVGDPRVRGGKGYPIGTGWAGQIGGILVEGANLHETLLLNLVLPEGSPERGRPGDTAVWERAPQGPGVEVEGRRPSGPADLLTWQSRRVRLSVAGDDVVGVLIANGDPLHPRDLQAVETMTAWRRSEAQEKTLKSGVPVYMPRTHGPDRALWRGLPALLPLADAGGDTRGGPAKGFPAGALTWLGHLIYRGYLDERYPLRTRAIGVGYGSQSSVVDEVVDDALLVHAVLLGEHGRLLRTAAVDAVAVTAAAVDALGALAANVAQAGGGEREGSRDRAREMAYFALDAPYRTWLGSLTPGADAQERRAVWERHVARTVRGLAEQVLDQAGAPAWVGREVRSGSGSRYLSSSLAEVWFRADLHRALVLAAPDQPPAGADERTDT